MISLAYPMDSSVAYMSFGGAFVGPFRSSDFQPVQFDPIEVRSEHDILYTNKNTGHAQERYCNHRQTKADLKYQPWMSKFTPRPIASQLDRVSYDPTMVYAEFGMGEHAHVGLTGSGSNTVQKLYDRLDSMCTYYQVTNSSYNPSRAVGMYVFRLTSITKVSASTARIVYSYTYYYCKDPVLGGAGGVNDGKDWTVKRTLQDAIDLIPYMRIATPTTQYTVDKTMYSPSSGFVKSPSACIAGIEMMIHRMPNLDSYHGEATPFGDLAMRASEQANANSVNMLEFLKDMRRPTELIPKLRNLRNLKGLSGEYLGLNFGLLPTISDIRSIIGAFSTVSALDRQGNHTYYASSNHVGSESIYKTDLVQHLKLAVAKEDNGLEALISAFESMGVLPNFENVWDLLPYSFLIDWVINVGGLLERFDASQRIERFNVDYVTMSQKLTVTLDLLPMSADNTLTGPIRTVHYHRWVSDQCPVPAMSLQFGLPAPSHWLEAAALLIQRRK